MKALRYLAAWLVLLPAVTSCKEYNICPNGTVEEITGNLTGLQADLDKFTLSEDGEYHVWSFSVNLLDICPDGLMIYEIRVSNLYRFGYTKQHLYQSQEGELIVKNGKIHKGFAVDLTSYSHFSRAGLKDIPFDATITIYLYYRKSPDFPNPRDQLAASLRSLQYEFSYVKNN